MEGWNYLNNWNPALKSLAFSALTAFQNLQLEVLNIQHANNQATSNENSQNLSANIHPFQYCIRNK